MLAAGVIVFVVAAFALTGYLVGHRTRQAIERSSVLLLAQLTEIHQLVNSDMTATRQELLDQTEVTLVMLRRVVMNAVADGHTPDPDDVAAIEKTRKRITMMRTTLADRLDRQLAVEADAHKASTARSELK